MSKTESMETENTENESMEANAEITAISTIFNKSNYKKLRADAFHGMLRAKYTILACEMLAGKHKEPNGFIPALPENATVDDQVNHAAMCMFYEGVRFGIEFESETPGSIKDMK